MIASKEADRNAPVLPTPSCDGATEQPHLVSPTAAPAVYHMQPNSERISHAHFAMPAVVDEAGSSDAPTTTDRVSSDSSFNRDETPSSSAAPQMYYYIQQETRPSMISHNELPTYTQASMSEEGATPSGHPSPSSEFNPYLPETTLPDILYSHIIPRHPAAALPNQHRQQRTRHRQDEGHNRGNRHRHRVHSDRIDRHRRQSSWTRSTSSSQMHEGTCKEPCVKCMVTVTSFRWVLVVLSILGVCCVVTGIVLASLHAAGQSFLFLAIMFIGLGVLLVIVVGVGWKCTPRGHEPLHALFGIGGFMQGRSRGRRHRRHRNRDRSWAGGMMYPEFQFRRPPPSYAASMQDYHSQVTPEQDESSSPRSPVQSDRVSPPSSPPPSYRSRTSTCHSGILTAFPNIHDDDESSSRPPTYRSRASSHRPSFPREYRFEQDGPETELGALPPPEVSSTETSCEGISSVTHNRDVTASSESSALLQLPVAGPSVAEDLSDNLSLSEQPTSLSVTSKVQTLPLDRRVETNTHQSSNLSQNTQSFVSGASALAYTFALENQSGARPPSLLQRLDSEDRLILEQTLQSIDHIDDSGGIINEGASFDELSQ